MPRPVLTLLTAIVTGAAGWAVAGILAALALGKTSSGPRDGGAEMTGFFFVGGIAGLLAFVAGAWFAWTRLGDPALAPQVHRLLYVGGGLLAIALLVLFAPSLPKSKPVLAQLEIEVRIPPAQQASVRAATSLHFEFRSAGLLEVKNVKPPAADLLRVEFPLTAPPRPRLLALMAGDQQIFCSTLNAETDSTTPTNWSEWESLEFDFAARWRIAALRAD